MKHSTDRILTTHAGSLPRPADLLAMSEAKQDGRPGDGKAYEARLAEAVAEIVRKQAELGIDIIDDGEYGKPGFVTYVNDRLSGFEVDTERTGRNPWAGSREARAFPEFYALSPHAGSRHVHMVCTAPIAYRGHAALARDIDNLRAALAGVRVEEAFIPAISPANVEDWQRNRYYATQEEYLFAIADALREEYRAIVEAGFLVQIDDPRFAMHYMLTPEESVDQARAWARRRVEALNHALRNIPIERVRHHTCYGINMGPRTNDMEMKHLADIIVTIRAGGYSFEMANPRHEHEWRVWEHVTLPEGRVLIPGCVTQACVVVEHPDLVAERIVRLARIVGRERVIAGTDCGFASTLVPGQRPEIEPEIVWAKLRSLVEGARIATRELWA
jgi:5-methyltetrahydropteroyltriglutamate--homocysteine methyltransferase